MVVKFQLFILIGLAYILGCNFCRADLGETYAQMLAHYEAVDPEDEHPNVNHPNEPFTCGFLKGPYSVIASFQNGVVTSEIIAKLDHSRFSDAEITNVLKENCLADTPWRGPVLIDEVKHGSSAFSVE